MVDVRRYPIGLILDIDYKKDIARVRWPLVESPAVPLERLKRVDGVTDEERATLDGKPVDVPKTDVLVMAAPMYNFAIPSTLKAWLDHVLRAGVTFKYTETGPQGLLSGKRAYVLTARGGIYAGSTADHQEPYLRQVMGFIGIHDVTFIHAEGMNLGGDFQEKGLNQANAKLSQVA